MAEFGAGVLVATGGAGQVRRRRSRGGRVWDRCRGGDGHRSRSTISAVARRLCACHDHPGGWLGDGRGAEQRLWPSGLRITELGSHAGDQHRACVPLAIRLADQQAPLAFTNGASACPLSSAGVGDRRSARRSVRRLPPEAARRGTGPERGAPVGPNAPLVRRGRRPRAQLRTAAFRASATSGSPVVRERITSRRRWRWLRRLISHPPRACRASSGHRGAVAPGRSSEQR